MNPLHVSKPVRKHDWKVTDIIIGVVILIVISILTVTLLKQLSLKREVADATVVTNQMMNDVVKQDAKHARSLGDKIFQMENSEKSLSTQFKDAHPYATGTPTIERKTVTNDDKQQAVSIVYKFPHKPAFYLRVIVVKPKGTDKWQVVNISGNTDLQPLLKNNY